MPSGIALLPTFILLKVLLNISKRAVSRLGHWKMFQALFLGSFIGVQPGVLCL